ncbi:hypothetical protein PAXRUDRAFT_826390 [Paxillus rubicundulus Ve08.2h10]|uniref:F-box domain-containing protein n=1 Tax=Paxillus rubicundulus Ve08.2h10 TaxID=930991 RepID=A0A0D0E9T4_9AGAM|nr:hypothetical protein PAXRUDRAFT_826390 [Paxillus rubicundulus Ve08.2h10]
MGVPPPLELLTFPSVTSTVDPSGRKSLAEEAQARIDEEILIRYLPICTLRTQRNALSPISRLPDELFAAVFVHNAQECYSSSKRRTWPPPSVPSWVNVSYVCNHWRTVALDCPTLWTYLFFVSRPWMAELLTRSKMAPLCVQLDLSFPNTSLQKWEMLFPHLPRVKELHIRSLSCVTASQLISRLTIPTPLLQSLHLSRRHGPCSTAVLDGTPSVLPVILSGMTPSLRSLELSKLDIAWHALALSAVTNLKLRDMPSPPTMDSLASILAQMPELRELELEHTLRWDPSLSRGALDLVPDKVTLPRLSRLVIVAPTSAAVRFLSHVHIPASTQTRLKCSYQGRPSIFHLLPYSTKRIDSGEDGNQVSPPTGVLRSLNIEGCPPLRVHFTCGTSEDGYKYSSFSIPEASSNKRSNHDWDCAIPLKMDLDRDSESLPLSEIVVGDVCRDLSLTHLQSLAVGIIGSFNFSETFWKEIFTLAQGLRFVKLKYTTSLRGLVTALAPNHHEHGKGGDSRFVALALASIELEQVSFTSACGARTQGDSNNCQPTVGCLCDALTRRKAVGLSLGMIAIHESDNVAVQEVQELRRVVCQVTWDEIDRAQEATGEWDAEF